MTGPVMFFLAVTALTATITVRRARTRKASQ